MTRRTWLLLLAVVACDKPSSGGPAPAASVSVGAAPSTASAAATASSTPTAAAATQSWRGTYKSAAAPLAVPPGWKGTKVSDPQPSAGVGEGAVALTVDGARGHVSGTIDGPLGPATIDGVVTDGKLAATLRRKDPTDQGVTGTALGAVAGGKLEGTLQASLATNGALRTASFALTPAGATP
jgi:hypothetical protein